jgi:PRC-barrel domain
MVEGSGWAKAFRWPEKAYNRLLARAPPPRRQYCSESVTFVREMRSSGPMSPSPLETSPLVHPRNAKLKPSAYKAAAKHIGEVDHLISDKLSGRVAYAVISFGGFIGPGHSHYPIPWAALSYDK